MIATLYVLAYLWLFWLAYVLVMGIYRAHLAQRLTPLTYTLALPIVVLGYLMDIAANLTLATLIFFEPPREWLVTSRLIRLNRGPDSWRRRLATAVCERLLDVFDPTGDHC